LERAKCLLKVLVDDFYNGTTITPVNGVVFKYPGTSDDIVSKTTAELK